MKITESGLDEKEKLSFYHFQTRLFKVENLLDNHSSLITIQYYWGWLIENGKRSNQWLLINQSNYQSISKTCHLDLLRTFACLLQRSYLDNNDMHVYCPWKILNCILFNCWWWEYKLLFTIFFLYILFNYEKTAWRVVGSLIQSPPVFLPSW